MKKVPKKMEPKNVVEELTMEVEELMLLVSDCHLHPG